MKKYLLIFTTILLSFTSFSQVGIGTSNPNSNSILELQATNRALLLPRVANTAAVPSPIDGMVVYDISSNCTKSFENGAWSSCWSSNNTSNTNTATVTVDCNNSGFQGTMLSGIAITNGFYRVTIVNNTFASVTIPLAAADLVLSGNTAGSPAVTVGIISTTAGGASITSIAIPALQSQTLFYKINGNPTASGTLNAVWTKGIFSCQSSTVIGAPLATLNCAGAVLNGTLFNSTLASGVSSDIPYTGGDGNAHPGQVVTSTGVTGLTATLLPGNFAVGNGNLNYVITGTPNTTGVATFAIAIGGRTCNLTTNVISASTNGIAIVSAYVCNTASAGTLFVGTAASGVTQTITATVTKAGTYNISTTTESGITFSGSGTFPGTGARTIVLTATGTPNTIGTATYSLLTTPTCSFTRVINPPAVLVCNSAVITTNNWELINGNSYNGSIAIPYTMGNTAESYPAETIVSNGLTFTRNAGTYATSGNITYDFSGTFTGTTNTTFDITVDGFAGACTFVIFDAIRGALAQAGCASCTNYDNAAINTPVQITKDEYDRIALIAGATKSGLADATIATNSPNPQNFAGNTTFTSNNLQNTQIPASNFIMAFQVRTSASAPSNMAGIQLKTGTVHNGPYTNYGSATTATNNNLASTNYFFVYKRPTATTASSSDSFFAFYITATFQIQVYPSGNGTFYNATGNVNSFGTAGTTGQRTYAQFLTTPTRQW